jgi:hypothetical protein
VKQNAYYCPELNKFTVLEEDDDGVILIKNASVELKEVEEDDSFIITVS